MSMRGTYTHVIPLEAIQAEQVRIAAVLAEYEGGDLDAASLLDLTISVAVWKFCEVLRELKLPWWGTTTRTVAPDGSVEVIATFTSQADLDLLQSRMLASRSP